MVQGAAKNRLTRAQAGGDTHNRPDNASHSRVSDAWPGAEIHKVLLVSCQSSAQEKQQNLFWQEKLALTFASMKKLCSIKSNTPPCQNFCIWQQKKCVCYNIIGLEV